MHLQTVHLNACSLVCLTVTPSISDVTAHTDKQLNIDGAVDAASSINDVDGPTNNSTSPTALTPTPIHIYIHTQY